MKNLILIGFVLIFFTSCSNKLPVPGSKNVESILIIPQKATNSTKNPLGFKYTFTLMKKDGGEKIIEFYPRVNKKFFIFDSLVPGKYKFLNRSDCLAVKGKTKNNCRQRKTKPIKFTLSKNTITILKSSFNIRQSWKNNMNSISAKFFPVKKKHIKEIIIELKELENFDKWTVIESRSPIWN